MRKGTKYVPIAIGTYLVPLSLSFDSPHQCTHGLSVPARKASALDDEIVGVRKLDVIMESEAGLGILPAHNLAETKIVEDEGVADVIECVIALREANQSLNVFFLLYVAEEMLLPREIVKVNSRIAIKHRTIADVKSIFVFRYNVP